MHRVVRIRQQNVILILFHYFFININLWSIDTRQLTIVGFIVIYFVYHAK